jgi:DNA-binding transcriptional ArsR family regulator
MMDYPLTMKENESGEMFIIRDLPTLRVIADPLRTQILETITFEPLTVKQVAERLGLAPSKLYYHINMLEEYGLIEVAETRVVSGIIEKQYRSIASQFDVDAGLLNFSTREGKEGVHTILTTTLDTTREDIRRSLEARLFQIEQGAQEQPRNAFVTRHLARIPDARAEAFRARLFELIKEFEAADKETAAAEEELQMYALTIALYPSFYYQEKDQ